MIIYMAFYCLLKLDVDYSITRHSFKCIQYPLFHSQKASGRSIHPSRRCGWSVVRFTWRSRWPQWLVGLAICRMSSDQNLRAKSLSCAKRWVLSPSRPVVYWQINILVANMFLVFSRSFPLGPRLSQIIGAYLQSFSTSERYVTFETCFGVV